MENLNVLAERPAEDVRFELVEPSSLVIPEAPRFTFGPFSSELSKFYFSLYGVGRAGVFTVPKANVFGSHIFGRADVLFVCENLNIHPAYIEQALRLPHASPEMAQPRNLRGRHVILTGPGYGVYGHWLVDFLPKLYVLHAAGYAVRELKYLVPGDIPSFGLRWLDLLGIGEDCLVTYDPRAEVVQPDELLLPTFLHNGLRMSPIFGAATQFLSELIRDRHGDLEGAPYGERIFLSRRFGPQTRPLSNRAEIEGMAERAGFSIVHPEKLPLIEQVRLFKGARELVGEYGSAMHGSIFSPPDTIVGALRGSARHPAFIQSGIGQSLGQPTGYVFGPTDDRDPAQGFTVSEEDFADCLRLIFDGVPLRSAKIDAAVERSGPAGRGIGVRGADAGRTLDAQGANMPHSGLSQSLDEIGLKFQTDKASHHHGYLGFYERFFADLRDRKDLRLLEIGVHQGASARMWEEYFPDGRIIGVDVNPDARQHASGRIVVELADQSDVAALVALGAHGPFDIIIDDGSHVWDHQITSFRYLYPLLKAGGYYVMEDIDTSFGAAAETYRGVGDRSAAEYLHHFCNYLVGDPALDISREPDAFIRSYARKTEFLAFHRRTCVMRRKAG